MPSSPVSMAVSLVAMVASFLLLLIDSDIALYVSTGMISASFPEHWLLSPSQWLQSFLGQNTLELTTTLLSEAFLLVLSLSVYLPLKVTAMELPSTDVLTESVTGCTAFKPLWSFGQCSVLWPPFLLPFYIYGIASSTRRSREEETQQMHASFHFIRRINFFGSKTKFLCVQLCVLCYTNGGKVNFLYSNVQ